MHPIRLVATDLDGTFLMNDKSVSRENLEALRMLGEKGIVRVAATGRNLMKVNEVLAPEVPFDYIVYSSGAGVYCWKSKNHIFTQNISEEAANLIIKNLIARDLNFHAFWPAPDNHHLWFYRGNQSCEEFERYFEFHRALAFPLNESGKVDSPLCQFLVVIPDDEERFTNLKRQIEDDCPEVRVIRATSPLGTGYIWLEIFHHTVSKGNGVLHICDLLEIQPENTVGIGNDYNDIDLLEFTNHSFLTENAPEPLKQNYRLLPSNEENAFAHIISQFLI